MEKNGNGTGTIASDPGGIDCGPDCQELYAGGRTVTMTGTPDPGSALDGWSIKECPGNGPCRVSMDDHYPVKATFNPDGDADGISDVVENNGPNNGDGNGDGIPDSQQQNVAGFPDINGSYATLVSPQGTVLKNVYSTCLPSPGDLPANHECPCGNFGFEVHGLDPGGAVDVTMILHTANASITTYDKYGPTPDNAADHWYEFPLSDGAGAKVTTGNGQTVIQLSFVDGRRGDGDLTANGVIADPGAPAIESSGSSGSDGGGSCFISDMW